MKNIVFTLAAVCVIGILCTYPPQPDPTRIYLLICSIVALFFSSPKSPGKGADVSRLIFGLFLGAGALIGYPTCVNPELTDGCGLEEAMHSNVALILLWPGIIGFFITTYYIWTTSIKKTPQRNTNTPT